LKTLISKNMHLATFVDIVSIQKNPETKKEYALVLLNLYGNICSVKVPQNIIPFIETLKSGDNLLVLIKKTPTGEYFLYGIEKLNNEIYN